jgi:DNA-binding HxlR family transcriptional regulator
MENIPGNILASRLKTLMQNKLIRKTPYQSNPLRYEYFLTEAGEDLLPLVNAMAKWAAEHVAGTRLPRRLQYNLS